MKKTLTANQRGIIESMFQLFDQHRDEEEALGQSLGYWGNDRVEKLQSELIESFDPEEIPQFKGTREQLNNLKI